MTETLGAALERASLPQDTANVQDLIYSMETELNRSLQTEGAAAILMRHYYSAIRSNEALRQCTPVVPRLGHETGRRDDPTLQGGMTNDVAREDDCAHSAHHRGDAC
jgi:hypothetical protein